MPHNISFFLSLAYTRTILKKLSLDDYLNVFLLVAARSHTFLSTPSKPRHETPGDSVFNHTFEWRSMCYPDGNRFVRAPHSMLHALFDGEISMLWLIKVKMAVVETNKHDNLSTVL